MTTTTTTAASVAPQPHRHDDDPSSKHYRIALYYCYVPIPDVESHIKFQKRICGVDESESDANDGRQQYSLLKGRIRVASEGVNGVLSGRVEDLKQYETKLREELLLRCCSSSSGDHDDDGSSLFDFDVKYCQLRTDISVKSQMFQSLSVQSTKYVVSLVEERQEKKKKNKSKKKRNNNSHNKEGQQQQQQDIDIDEKLSSSLNGGDDDDVQLVDTTSYYQIIKDVWEKSKMQIEERIAPKESSSSSSSGLKSNYTRSENLDDGNKDYENEEEASSSSSKEVVEGKVDEIGAIHLSPSEWNQRLDELTTTTSSSKQQQQQQHDDDKDNNNNNNNNTNTSDTNTNNVAFIDCRNFYESNIGYFQAPNTTTILTNTRKFTELPQVFVEQADELANKDAIFMYCTGGVRCERASVFLKNLLEEKKKKKKKKKESGDGDGGININKSPQLYQLRGGIQRYLEDPDTALHYRGKNFVFDPRRTDPVCYSHHHHGSSRVAAADNDETEAVVGQCLVCHKPHDDYDNGHAPVEGKEARCWNCRILILVCNDCRMKVSCWGEEEEGGEDDDDNKEKKPRMYCGGMNQGCLHKPPVKRIN